MYKNDQFLLSWSHELVAILNIDGCTYTLLYMVSMCVVD